ncbi:chromosome segregation protein SMC [Uliginosibacterium sp. 31-16]|uniref:chromosome segregation protein SMC n=1 Tax=Uliginosibacterium sp. 31-16 TaxID=3068315 RepID=UPI00273FC185|nr:chromosome segregation protein SMC [Uliginosibacterium sp. 31-16]MDP5239519.1 chromosome segregation protein SMC [Uliginosibacterium sp. 31-16]
MRLSKLKLAGFKSFVDPTTVLTPGQLVGIVGPNGCGKSNVIDAVRWVLGESRASALRGESMADVIFNGSTTRKPVSRASVEMIFDNAEGRAAGQWSQYAEISVKRQVDRNGGSDYFINNVSVRRKDVIDLFLGTGLGPKAYAIIEQGMISRVIEARPEEVRAFLEEAAGITKYKERRRETEGRLSDARDNLARVEDIRAELGQQIDKLAAQAEIALRYKDLSSQLSQKQVLLWRYKHTAAQREQTQLREAIAQTQTALEENNHKLIEAETHITLAREAHVVHTEAVSAAQGDVFTIANEVTRIESELRSLRDTHARITQRGSQLLADETLWQERLNRSLAEQEARIEQGAIAHEKLELSLLQVAEAEERLPEAEDAWRDALAALEETRRSLSQIEQHVRVEDTKRIASERALEALAQRRSRMEAERAGLRPEDEAALAALELEVAELVAQQQEAELLLGSQQEQLEEAQAALLSGQAALQAASSALTQQRARLDALRGLQSSLRDQGDLAGWLRAAGLADEARVWQSLQVDAGWELAVEAVLRERIAAIGPLTGDLAAVTAQAAPSSIVLLRKGQPPAPRGTPFTASLLEEHVRCQRAELAPHLAHWLDGVYAVDDITPWLDGERELPSGVLLVSRSGQILGASSLSLFAPDAGTHGAIERQREIETLEHAILPAEAALEELHSRVADDEEDVKTLQAALGDTRRVQQQLQSRLHERQLAFVKVQQEQARHVERIEQLAREAAELLRLEGVEHAHLEEAELARLSAEERLEALQDAALQASARTANTEAALRTAREALASCQHARHEAELAVREGNAKLDELNRTAALAQAQLEKLAVERSQLSEEQGALDDSALQTSLQTALDLRRTREAVVAQRREELEAIGQQLKALEASRHASEQTLAPMRDQLADLRLKLQAAELGSAQAAERLGELGAEVLALDEAVMAEIRELALSREVSRLGREIAEMGAVNLAALAELDSAKERKNFLDMQFDDLMRAIDTLENAIRRIDKDTREQLNETYATVNRHFSELFPRLFGGGRAELVLTGDDLLDAGVQIVAQPPGKKNSSIHLLSGGEKALTAIALVFAMFQLNPAPFCMLDEVDAPLDDTNTERYCEMVKHMSAVTQFIFISHSKITMEMGQQLIGVTMQEQGVSRVVEVDIEAALKLAQPEAA